MMAFREDKATALAAVFLECAGGSIEYLKLLKLMYLAERESMRLLGTSITDDIFVSMKHGPVLSSTYDLIKENWDDIDHATWMKTIAKSKNFKVQLRVPIDPLVYLSPFEVQIAQDLWGLFKDVDQWQIVKWIHETFPEWTSTTSSIKIEDWEIFKALGFEDEEIARRENLKRSVRELERMLSQTNEAVG